MVLEYARREERALLTINRKHFIRLHKDSSHHAGILVCSFDPHFEDQAHRIHEALESYGGDIESQLLRMNRPQGS